MQCHLMRNYREELDSLQSCTAEGEGCEQSLQQVKFWLGRKNIFAVRVVRCCNRGPGRWDNLCPWRHSVLKLATALSNLI